MSTDGIGCVDSNLSKLLAQRPYGRVDLQGQALAATVLDCEIPAARSAPIGNKPESMLAC
jgi:hypothetical protein